MSENMTRKLTLITVFVALALVAWVAAAQPKPITLLLFSDSTEAANNQPYWWGSGTYYGTITTAVCGSYSIKLYVDNILTLNVSSVGGNGFNAEFYFRNKYYSTTFSQYTFYLSNGHVVRVNTSGIYVDNVQVGADHPPAGKWCNVTLLPNNFTMYCPDTGYRFTYSASFGDNISYINYTTDAGDSESYVDCIKYLVSTADYVRLAGQYNVLYPNGTEKLAGPGIVYPAPVRVWINSSVVEPVFPGETIAIVPAVQPMNVSVSFQDYGEGLNVLEFRNINNEIVERRKLDVNGQGFFHLDLGGSYNIYAMRDDGSEVRGIGTVTVTDLNVQLSLPLDVPPSIVLGGKVKYSRVDTDTSTTIAVSSPEPVDVVYEISNDTWSTNITYNSVYNASYAFVHGGDPYTVRVTVMKDGEVVASRVFYVGQVRLTDPPWRSALIEMLQQYVPEDLQALAPVQLWLAVFLGLLVLVTFGVKDALPIGAVGAGIVMVGVQVLLGGVTIPGVAVSLLFLIGGLVAFRRGEVD